MTKNEELMVITMEECAVLIHQCSKAIRKKEFEKNDALKEELCDVICMLDLMVENKIITNMELNNGANLKRLKLMQWSILFKK